MPDLSENRPAMAQSISGVDTLSVASSIAYMYSSASMLLELVFRYSISGSHCSFDSSVFALPAIHNRATHGRSISASAPEKSMIKP